MPDYKATTVEGTINKWTRCHQIVISNQYMAQPSITFFEEQRINYPDGTMNAIQAGPTLVEPFTNPLTEIPLIQPETGASLGVMTHQALYLGLYGLYFQLALRRDASVLAAEAAAAAAAAVVEPPVEPPVEPII